MIHPEADKICPNPPTVGQIYTTWRPWEVDPAELHARSGAILTEAQVGHVGAGVRFRGLVVEGVVMAAAPLALPEWKLVFHWATVVCVHHAEVIGLAGEA